jgi:hypothetical protein
MLADLEADRAHVADLEAQISHLERSLSALREEKMLAQERLDSYKYPVLTLPNEIVSDIFMHFLPAFPQYPPLTGLLSPTLLTHICRKWREIALSTPALWSAIGISYHDGIQVPLKQKAHILDLWLNRSRCCPLSLQFGGGSPRLDITQVLKTVIPRRARWEHLDLYLPSSHLPTIDGPMPLLRRLNLFLSDSPATATEVFAFGEVPLLRTVVLNHNAALNVILPWAQLTSLTLFSVFRHDCDSILQQTSNLVRCVLQLEGMYGDNDQPGPDITLPYLESLSIDQYDATPVTDFLETFIVPALRRLEIPEACLGTSPLDSLTGFISKAGCKLEKVYINGPRSFRQNSYRKAFPLIRRFSFDGEDDSSGSDALGVEDNSISD